MNYLVVKMLLEPLCKDLDENDLEFPSFTNELTTIARILEKIVEFNLQ